MPAAVPDDVLSEFAERYDVPVDALVLVGGGEPSSDGVRYAVRGDPARILKVQALEPSDGIGKAARLERLTLAAMLAADDAPLPSIWPSRLGSLMEHVDHSGATFVAYVVGWLPGRTLGSLPREARTPHLAALGRALGRMHASSRRMPTWRASSATVGGHPVLSWEAERQHFSDSAPDPAVGEVWTRIGEELADVPIERDGFGFVHNDAHLYNVLVDGDRLRLIDLDVATYHWFAADLATAVFAATGDGRFRDALALRQVTQLIEGYLSVYPLDRRWIDALPLFIEYRRALLFIAMHAELPAGLRAAWYRSVVDRHRPLDPSWPTLTG